MIIKLVQWYRKYYVALLNVFIALLVMDVMIDPKNKIFQVKYILFCLVFLVWLPQLIRKRIVLPKYLLYIIFFISLFMPIYALSIGLLNSFILNIDMAKEIYYFSGFLFFLLLIIIHHQNYDLTKNFNYASLLIVVVTLGSYAILLLAPAISGILFQYMVVDTGTAAMGLRNYGNNILLMVHYRTSPLLVFPLSYILHQVMIENNRKYLFLRLIVLFSIILTLLLSGTRANIISLLLIILFYIAYFIYKKSKIIFVFLCSIMLILSLYALPSLIGILFDKQEASNLIKYGHLISYIDYFSSNIFNLIFGQGLGMSFYSSGDNRLELTSELTYLEIVRIWGLPIAFLFISTLLLPIIKEIQSKSISSLFIAYIAYLFIAGTNPFLLDSTGMLVLVYVFSKIRGSEIKEQGGIIGSKIRG